MREPSVAVIVDLSGVAPGSLNVLGRREQEKFGSIVKSISVLGVVLFDELAAGEEVISVVGEAESIGAEAGEEATTVVGEGSLLRRFLDTSMGECSSVRCRQIWCGTSNMDCVSCPAEELGIVV